MNKWLREFMRLEAKSELPLLDVPPRLLTTEEIRDMARRMMGSIPGTVDATEVSIGGEK